MFRHDLRQQALLHTRHRVKRTVEYRVDGRFTNINALEEHMQGLVREINPRGLYEDFCRKFSRIAAMEDYAAILKVYNQKSMVPRSNIGQLCGLPGNKEAYVQTVLAVLKSDGPEAVDDTRRDYGLLRSRIRLLRLSLWLFPCCVLPIAIVGGNGYLCGRWS